MSQLQPTPATPRQNLMAIRIVYGAILAGATLFSIIVLVLNTVKKTVSPVKEFNNIILAGGIAIALILITVARNGYTRSMDTAKNSLNSLNDKLNLYRSALIVYIALCDGPAIFGIILFFITGYYLMFIITILSIIAILLKAPSKQRVIDDLSLDWQQQQEL